MAKEFSSLLEQINDGQNSVLQPKSFRTALQAHCPIFNNSKQQDANECLSIILDALCEDLNRVKTKQAFDVKSEQIFRELGLSEE